MPAPYPPPPAVYPVVQEIAELIAESCGQDPDYLEPGDAYGVDAVLPNGDPAHYLWRQHVETAEEIVALRLELTPAMIEAGAAVIYNLWDLPAPTITDGDRRIAREVFTAMMGASDA